MNTSAYTDINFFKSIQSTAENYNISISKVFRDLLDITSSKITKIKITGILTEYQHKDSYTRKVLHYCPDVNQFETYSEIRQKLKISVSKLAFIGFILFWNELLEKYEKTKNYKCPKLDLVNYESFRSEFKESLIYFKKRLNIIQIE